MLGWSLINEMDDVRDDVIIAHRFETDPSISGVWHLYFDATIVIAACILVLTALVIYVAHWYRRTRVHVTVRTIIFNDSSDVSHNTKKRCICMCNFVVRDQLASLQPCQREYHRRCIARTLSRALTYPICRRVPSDSNDWRWHTDDWTRLLSFSFFFFFFFVTIFYVHSLLWLYSCI